MAGAGKGYRSRCVLLNGEGEGNDRVTTIGGGHGAVVSTGSGQVLRTEGVGLSLTNRSADGCGRRVVNGDRC